MKKIFIFVILFVPLSVFADNLIFNGGFDMTPWDSGWTKNVTISTKRPQWITYIDSTIRAGTGKSYPNCCSLNTACTARYDGSNEVDTCWSIVKVRKEIFQTFTPVSNCIFKAWLSGWLLLSGHGMFTCSCGDTVQLCINGVWKRVWEIKGDGNYYSYGWTEFCDTIKNPVSGVKFISYGDGSALVENKFNIGGSNNFFYIDDVSIEILRVEESTPLSGHSIPTLQISQNPFSKSTVITYFVGEVSQPRYVSLAIYDLTGRCVKTLFNELKPAGSYSTTLNANELKTGVYFVRLTTGTTKLTKKLILMK
ncbi:MAG: T9SS type A sorting domain-containing protein [bacterium]